MAFYIRFLIVTLVVYVSTVGEQVHIVTVDQHLTSCCEDLRLYCQMHTYVGQYIVVSIMLPKAKLHLPVSRVLRHTSQKGLV